MRTIELLSPAKNLECGLAAINHGADSVYIGAPAFSARSAAGNSIADIEALVKYAHRFRAKVLVALNTILTDAQLHEAEKLIHQIYETGADALIVQDMGILQLDIPPIALHASTQTDNRTLEKVKFLQDVGFSRAVLARELTLNQIKQISQNTDIELECFIHGALCVSYSGQCYISEAMTGRSANRGECSQYCRLPYSLTDAGGNLLIKNKHLLSLKDLDMSEHLEELIDAGITSFKIEGRLKDADYVKNITAFYRKKLDAILEQKKDIQKSSLGKTTFFFEPNPEKSFRRGATDYFFEGRKTEQSQIDTPKSLGEEIGRATYVGSNFIEIQTNKEIHNGDGLCFLNNEGVLQGFRVNKIENKKIFPLEKPNIEKNTLVFRNQDHEFDKILSGKTSERKMEVNMEFSEKENGFSIQITDEENITVSMDFPTEKQPAKNAATAKQNIVNQLSKLGNTIFEAKNISVKTNADWFIPASQINEWRRQIVDLLETEREKQYHWEKRKPALENVTFPGEKLTYLGNVINEKAAEFYRQFGVQEILPGFEVKAEEDVPLMYCKYCVKHALGWCPKEGYKAAFKEPLFLHHKNEKFRLEFDCKKCEMRVYSETKR
ncbi:Uncharacterized protease YdcP [uncultured Paludibacter sp.]|nr:Uncharacterized protease YdcP [uncultured Paludibacter sp.]